MRFHCRLSVLIQKLSMLMRVASAVYITWKCPSSADLALITRVDVSETFSADQLWFRILSGLFQRCSLPENLWTALIQLWTALKTQIFRAKNQRWNSAVQLWNRADSELNSADFLWNSSETGNFQSKKISAESELFQRWFSLKQSWFSLKQRWNTKFSEQ